MTTGPGTAGNVIAALCSFFAPGLGQLLQGRVLAALLHFLGAGLLWAITFGMLGWVAHILSALDAAWHKPRA